MADGNLPEACERLERKLESTSTAALIRHLQPAQVNSVKKILLSEISQLKQAISADKQFLEIAKQDAVLCKDKIATIQKWEEDFQRLDAVLPVIKEQTNPAIAQPSISQGGHNPAPNVSVQNTLPVIRELDESEWKTVPSYIKNRLKLEQVNAFVQSVNKELAEKYAFLKKKRSTLNRAQLQLWASYKALETNETKGLYFIVTSDLKKMAITEKTISTMSSILRHCHRIREIRDGKIIRLIVIN